MTAPDTSPEAVERIASIIVKPLSTLKESHEAAALLRALSGELARARAELVHGICAVANGDMETADALLDKYMPNRPKLPELRQMSLAEVMAVVTGTKGPSHG